MKTVSRFSLLLLALLIASCLAQVRLPTNAYQPPNASVGNETSASTSSSSTDGANERWSQLLGNMLYFYDVQRAGTLPDDFRISWRNNSVPNDGSDVNLNLSGGHFDAGNYIKATFPLCFVITQIAWGAMMYGQAYESSRQSAYLDETLRTMIDFVMTASSTPDQIVVLIGTDDFYWGGDQNIPLNDRPSFVVTREKPGTDVFGSCASALASASMLYSGTILPVSPSQNGTAVRTLRNSTYAQSLLSRSETLFNIAQTATPMQVYQKVTKGVAWAYPSTDYADELVLSSTFLAMATGNATYAQYAQQTYTSSQFPFPNGAFNWDQHTPGTAVLLSQLSIMRPSMNIDLAKYQADSEYWLDGVVNGSMPQTFSTPGGLFYFKGDSDSASLNPALNAAFLLTVYANISSSQQKSAAYLEFAQSQLDYALGKNPMNAVYVVGQHPNSAQNPQSALASGGDNPKEIDFSPMQEAHVLYGGVVGGPDTNDNYYDERGNWQQTEVALDSQSALMALAAWQIVNNQSDPYYVGMTQDRVILAYSSDTDSDGGLTQGAQIAIAVVVVVVVLGALIGLAYWQREWLRSCFRRRKFSKV
jgi:endoglucanase